MTATRLPVSQTWIVSFCAAALALGLATGKATASDIIFTIIPTHSGSTWTGTNSFGAFVEQLPGSLSAPLSGHFLVSFDPLSGTPATLQFVGGHGYYEVASPYVALSGSGGSGTPAPANLAGKTVGNEVFWAARHFVWDFSSGPLDGSDGVFPATTTSFTLLSSRLDYNGSTAIYDGFSDSLTGGSWTLSESAPGSGDWTLASSGYYNFGVFDALFRASAVIVSSAHFGSTNVATVAPTDTEQESRVRS